MSRAYVGDLVRNARLGVGRLLAVRNGEARVRYFTGPSTSAYTERAHAAKSLAPAILSPHTRVYLREGPGWRIGRIEGGPDGLKRYTVAFPNLQGDLLATDAFEVRWDVPIEDPFAILESFGGDAPKVYESRLEFLRHWAGQRAAAVGVEGLLLASVELHRHQLAVVRRVSNDPVKRYLLADEVGLGKTIEAAALIWRFLDRKPAGRVLVLVPEHLRYQWADELIERFRTGKAPLWIRSLTDEARWPEDPVDLLVIDEAHRVTRNGALGADTRRRIAQIAHAAQELLLLSATPVRSNEAGFLDLLYLLDPANYRPDQVEEFTRRVHDRDKLALICQALVPDIDEFDLTLYAEQLQADYSGDALLADLLASATSADDESRAAAVTRVRQHLSEAYRLHQRMLRTRRTPDITASFGVRGRKRAKGFLVSVDDANTGQRTELLDRLRMDLLVASENSTLEIQECVDLFREAAQRCGSLPYAVLALRSDQAADPSKGLVSRLRELVDRGVVANLDQLIDRICAEREVRTSALVDALAQFTGFKTQSRVVLATAFAECAAAIADEMVRRWGRQRIATHVKTNDEDANRAAIERWTKGGQCSILIVDDSAEEGANLQVADLLVHLDLPWETFRIEQRIGRCDRHAPPGVGAIDSKVVIFGDEPYAMNWLEFVSDGCEAFTRSLSSLQYVLGDTERAVLANVLREGPEALGGAADEQPDKLAEELVRIVAHDALDEIDERGCDQTLSADRHLIKSDRDPALTRALVTWLEGVGTQLTWEDEAVIRISRRPRPQVPFDVETQIAAVAQIPIALRRGPAVSRRIPILRAGHPTVDTIAKHLLQSDRGVAFAMFRPWPGMSSAEIVFRADYLVSASFAQAFIEAADTLGVLGWVEQILQEVSPPIVEKVVMTSFGDEAKDGRLFQPYTPRTGDINLGSRPQLFEQLIASVDWTGLCVIAAEQTRAIASRRSSVVDRALLAANEVRHRIAQRVDRARARTNAGMVDTDGEIEQLETLLPERLELQIQPLGCGAIFVGDPGLAVNRD
ncbi:protein DpdE [Mycobacterium sp. E3339]|uniref:protein DpdE n=1 Tax=Mycobacterium sp. E3339 TaxID=1834146 RepID=UPI0009EDB67D|nr:protein DpdE [Mycobacterium sp. E3339]